MSFSSDVVKVGHTGDKIAGFFESEISTLCYQSLYDKFKEYFIIEVSRWYDTSAILEELSKQYTISMTDYYVSEEGWRVWVQEKEEAIITPLSEIKSTEENYYTLHGETIMGLYNEPSRYKSWVYKNSKSYVVTPEEWAKALSYFSKKHNIHNIEMDDRIIIFNSF